MGLRPRLRFRLDRAFQARDLQRLNVAVRSVVPDASIVPTGDVAWLEVVGPGPSPELVAAVAGACRTAGWLIVESRAMGGSLEDLYVELVSESERA
jgi:hypothetical protein